MNKWNKIKKTDLRSLGEVPTEVSVNIQAPELAPKDNRFTGRNKRIAFTCRPEFAEELKRLAYEENCYQIEVLERALAEYKKKRNITICSSVYCSSLLLKIRTLFNPQYSEIFLSFADFFRLTVRLALFSIPDITYPQPLFPLRFAETVIKHSHNKNIFSYSHNLLNKVDY